MADPIKLMVLKKIVAHLEKMEGVTDIDGVTPIDMTGRVYRGRSIFGAESSIPMISIIESNIPADGPLADTQKIIRDTQWTLLVQGFVENDIDNPLDLAYALEALTAQRLSMIVATAQRVGRPGGPAFPDIYLLGTRPN